MILQLQVLTHFTSVLMMYTEIYKSGGTNQTV